MLHTPYGGSSQKSTTSKAKVTYWHIPGGTDYDHAQVVTCYFDDMEQAHKFCSVYNNPSELASLEPLYFPS